MNEEKQTDSGKFEFTPLQRRVIAAGLSVLAFSMVLAFGACVLFALVELLKFTAPAITPVIVAMFLSMLLKPYYDLLYRYTRNRALSMALLFASILVPTVALGWLGGGLLVDQFSHLVSGAPQIVGRTSAWIQATFPSLRDMLMTLGVDSGLMLFFTDPMKFTSELISSFSSEYGLEAMKMGVGVIRYMFGLLSWLLVLVFLCVFLASPPVKSSTVIDQLTFLKADTRAFIIEQIDAFVDILVSFFRRQVLICLIEGVMYGIGFSLVGLPYGFVIGFMLGVLNLVPFFGSIVCLSVAIPLAYFGDGGDGLRLASVLGVWMAGQILDGYLITPKIQGNSTGLGYAGVIFSFLFWGMVFHSFFGLLLAIPLSAFCLVLWRAVKDRYFKNGVI